MTYDPYNPKQGDPYGQQPGQPYGQQPGQPYGAPQYPYGYPPQPKPQQNAILALVLSCVGFVTCGITAIVGVIFGHIAMGKIKRGEEDGRGLALAGLIVGYVVIVGWVLYFVFIVFLIGIGLNQNTY
ncbi:DUF4190 domain-containing protein [Lentzea alba]|uniref:DUF4190 domain-containing protein n=1 Tax=Lentzea alba TaxID=2714351 RepID=UPI0039BF96E8